MKTGRTYLMSEGLFPKRVFYLKCSEEQKVLNEVFIRLTVYVHLVPLADEITRNHHLAGTTCGEGTPFGEMIKYRTLILGIGAKANSLTQVHSAEDIMKDKFPIPLFTDTLSVNCLDESGNTIIYKLRIKNPEYVIDARSFRRIIKRAKIAKWTYKGIPFFLTQACDVTETFIEAAKNGETIYRERIV